MKHNASNWRPVLVLLLAAPVFGELISSSAPPPVFFIPWVFVLFVLMYGAGALLVRELTVRWQGGWLTLLLLGAAYGVVEEAFAAKSFFDPAWRSLGPLAGHGRFLGVNWIWAVDLMVFHAAFSIGLPVLLTYLLFPGSRQQRWLGRRGMTVVGLLFCLDILLFFQKANAYRPEPALYVGSGITVVSLMLAARRLRSRVSAGSTAPVSSKSFAVLGFSVSAAFILSMYALPLLGMPVLTLTAVVAIVSFAAVLLVRWTGAGSAWGERQQFSLLAGVLLFFALLGLFQEVNPSRHDPGSGMALVSIGIFVSLYWMRRRIFGSGSAVWTAISPKTNLG